MAGARKIIEGAIDYGKSLFKGAVSNPKVVQTGKAAIGLTVAGGLVTTMTQMASDPDKVPTTQGDVVNLVFPPDDSAGGFATEIRFHSWKKHPNGVVLSDEVNEQTSVQKTNLLGMLTLPMPLQLQTGYGQNFNEADSMTYDRDSTGDGWGFIDNIVGNFSGLVGEGKDAATSLFTLSGTAGMANASINNNRMGMIYQGTNLRGHTFSWRLSAKNESEWRTIQSIITTLKFLSSPGNNFGGSAEIERLKAAVEKAGGLDEKTAEEYSFWGHGGRLTIPPTVVIRFLNNGEHNDNLFKVKDSFITNVDVNYTAQGTWSAHYDGSPMEVQITITTKEVSIVTQADIVKGY